MILKMKQKNYQPILKALHLTFAIAIASYAIYYLVTHLEQLSSLKQLSPLTILSLALLNLFNTYIFGIRLRSVIHKKSDVTIPLGPWLKFFIISRFLGLYAGQAGNVYRATVLKSQYNISITKYVSSFVFITWIDTCLGLIFALLVIGLLTPSMTLFGINAIIIIIGLIIALSVIPLVAERILSRLHFSGTFFSWMQRRLSEMSHRINTSLNDRYFMLKISVIEILSFISSTLGLYLCFQGLGFEITFSGAALVFIIMKLCNRLIITPGNIGVREFAYGILSEQLNIGLAQGILVSVIGRIITLLITTTLGILCGGYETAKQLRKDNKTATDNSIENKIQS